jgi:DNA-binding response OmpR family regulator
MASSPPEAGPKPDPLVHHWVLVVMADPQQRRIVRRLLEEAGYAVEVAGTVAAAIRCLAVMKPSLVIIDEDMVRP